MIVTKEFRSSITDEEFKINHKLDCNSRCLVYLLTCKVCNIQYVGQTTDQFRKRWNNYKQCARKAADNKPHMQAHFHSHFLSEGHSGFEVDCDIRLIDKTDSSDPIRREQFWIRKLRTLHPDGLNLEETI